MSSRGDGSETSRPEYAERLVRLESAGWRRLLDVQRPYRWNLNRLHLGRVLDVGCGVGRNLVNLEGNGVGVDHNEESINVARGKGLTAYTTVEFPGAAEARPHGFDSLLLAHVLEHVDTEIADGIIGEYLPYIRPGGQVVLITPQELGYTSDATHVRFVDFNELGAHVQRHGLDLRRSFSFPLARLAGRFFLYNEFVAVARKPQLRMNQ